MTIDISNLTRNPRLLAAGPTSLAAGSKREITDDKPPFGDDVTTHLCSFRQRCPKQRAHTHTIII